jgi:hypothetical protein
MLPISGLQNTLPHLRHVGGSRMCYAEQSKCRARWTIVHMHSVEHIAVNFQTPSIGSRPRDTKPMGCLSCSYSMVPGVNLLVDNPHVMRSARFGKPSDMFVTVCA